MSKASGTSQQKTPPKKKRSLPFRIARALAYAVLALVAVVALGVGYLHTQSGKEHVRALLVKRLGERVNGSIEVDKLDYALLGKLELGGVRIKDKTGEQAIAIDSIVVAPSWGELGKTIALDSVEIKGVTVSIVKDAEGGSNVKGLIISKPITKLIDIRKLSIESVNVVVKSPDGTELAVRDVSLAGHVRALPSEKNVDIDLDPIALGVDLKKPAALGGMVLGVKNLKTGLAIAMTGGKGTLTLKPLSAELALLLPAVSKDGSVDATSPARLDKSFPIGWSGIELLIGDGDLGVSLEKLALGAVSLASVDLKAHLSEGSLDGAPLADVLGLHVDATQVNALLGRELLLSDVDLEAHLKGAANAPELHAALATKGGLIKLDAKLDTGDVAAPKHDVTLTITDVDTDKLLSSALAIPKLEIASLELHARGKGTDAKSIATNAELSLHGIKARGVTIDSLTARADIQGDTVKLDDIEIAAIDQQLHASGTFDRGTKKVTAKVSVNGDVGVALAKLKAAGLPITANLAAGLVKLPKDDLRVEVSGVVGGDLEVSAKAEKLSVLGGTVKLDANVSLSKGDVAKGEKSIKLEQFDATVDVDGLLLSNLLALRGKRIPSALGVDAALSVHLVGKGTLLEPLLDVRASAVELRKDGGARARLDIAGKVTKRDATLDVKVKNVANAADVLFAATAHLPLSLDGEKKGLDASRSLDVVFTLPRRELSSIASFVPSLLLAGRTLPKAEIELGAHLKGAVARPTADVHLDVFGAFLSPELATTPKQRLRVDATLDPVDKSAASKLAGTLSLAIDQASPPVVSGRFGATFPYSPLVAGGTAGAQFDAHLGIAAKLPALPDVPALARARALGGTVDGTIDVRGNAKDLTAELKLGAKGLTPDGKGPFDLGVDVALKPDTTTVALDVALANAPLAKLSGSLGLAGKGLLAQVKAGLDPKLDLTFDVPARSLASLSVLRPPLAKAPGVLAGRFNIGGSLKRVLADGAVAVSDVTLWDGQIGGATVALKLDDRALTSTVGIGKPKVEEAPVTLSATIAREELFGFTNDKTLAIDLEAHAEKVPLKQLVPKSLVEGVTVDPRGELSWNMTGRIELEKPDGKTKIKSGKLEGPLRVTGNVPIPGSKRVWQDVDISLLASGDALTIERIIAHESDVEVKGRSLAISGSLALDKLKPRSLDLAIKSDRWLLFGAKAIGLADAPRGSLTIDARAHADLDQPIKEAVVNIDKLEVVFPDRFDKAHQPEDVHVGDVVFLNEGPVELGKLAVPESVRKAAEARKQALEQAELARGALSSGLAAVEPATAPDTGFNVQLHIAKGARLFQSPLDLKTSGSLAINIRPSGRTIRGKLAMSSGELSLGGKMHPLKEGSLTFSDTYPQGNIDLWFEKPLAPWQLRNISEASAKKAITIHMFGPISDRRTVLGGAGSPGALYDLLSMHNTGRERLVAQPDMPDSYSVDFPQQPGLLALSFISVNLPHLLFLDRVAAWSDPYDDGRYGRMEHFDGERYFADGKGRVKAQKRPAGVGRSEADIEVDYLFVNDARLLFGVGGAAGSRGGGGPGLVLEWSSKD